MTEQPIILRPGRTTSDDGRAFAGYLDQAADGFFRFMLGKRSADIVAAAYLEPGHDLSHENVTFAERGNAPIGMLCAYTGAQHRRSTFAPVERAAGGLSVRTRVVQTMVTPMRRMADMIDDSDFYVLAIAVDAELRGAGVGTFLMNAAEERARGLGATRLALHVTEKNENARRFYERRGMKPDMRWPKRISIPGLTFYRMVAPLSRSSQTDE